MAGARVSGDGLRRAFVKLDRWRDAVQNPEPALRKVMTELETMADNGFAAGRRPLGGNWAPLSDNYRIYKSIVRPGAPILTFDGDLRASLGRERGDGAIRSVQGNTLRYGTRIHYAVYHNKGTPHMPARPVLPVNGKKLQAMVAKKIQEHILESGGAG